MQYAKHCWKTQKMYFSAICACVWTYSILQKLKKVSLRATRSFKDIEIYHKHFNYAFFTVLERNNVLIYTRPPLSDTVKNVKFGHSLVAPKEHVYGCLPHFWRSICVPMQLHCVFKGSHLPGKITSRRW